MAEKTKKEKEPSKDAVLEMIKGALGIAKNKKVCFADQYEAVKEVISTGVADLDRILTPNLYAETGKGGLPCGFGSEFYGPYAGGKSSLCHMLTATVTKNNGYVFWADAEGSYVNQWAEKHGVDTSKVILWNTEKAIDMGVMPTGEWYLENLEKIVGSGAVRLAVVDSVTALQPQDVMEGKLAEDAKMAALARMLSKFGPRIIVAMKKGNCAIVFINQLRDKIGVVYGNPETTPGGSALKYYTSTRLRLQRVTARGDRGILKDGEEIGMRCNVLLDKSRFGPAFRETTLPIYYGNDKPHPIDTLIDAALGQRIIKSQSRRDDKNQMVQHFRFGDFKCTGIDYLKNTMVDDAKMTLEIATAVKATKIAFEKDVLDYIASLESVTLEGKSQEPIQEGDPGA